MAPRLRLTGTSGPAIFEDQLEDAQESYYSGDYTECKRVCEQALADRSCPIDLRDAYQVLHRHACFEVAQEVLSSGDVAACKSLCEEILRDPLCPEEIRNPVELLNQEASSYVDDSTNTISFPEAIKTHEQLQTWKDGGKQVVQCVKAMDPALASTIEGLLDVAANALHDRLPKVGMGTQYTLRRYP